MASPDKRLEQIEQRLRARRYLRGADTLRDMLARLSTEELRRLAQEIENRFPQTGESK